MPLTRVVSVDPDRLMDKELMMVAESECPSTFTLMLLPELETLTEDAPLEPDENPGTTTFPLAFLRVSVPLENAPPIDSY